MTEKVDIAIIGGGVVGCAVAHELSELIGKGIDSVFLFESNDSIRGENQSSRNSGVVHAGVYYTPGTKKAKFCVEGNRMMYDFCKTHGVPAKQTGKLIVAVNQEEDQTLDEYEKKCKQNGVPVDKIDGKKANQYEPNVTAVSALHLPTSGIVDATGLVTKLRDLASINGAYFAISSRVIDVRPKKDYFQITAERNGKTETIDAKFVVNAAGLNSDIIARMANPDSPYNVVPLRGEAAKFYKTKRPNLWMNGLNVYPTPYFFDNKTGERIPKKHEDKVKDKTLTVGVHLTPTFGDFDGNIGSTVTIGPALTTGVSKTNYSNNLHPESHYLEQVERFFSGLRLEDIELHQAGILAKTAETKDFVIEADKRHPNFYNLVSIDSPGLTSSLAIAKHVKNYYMAARKNKQIPK